MASFFLAPDPIQSTFLIPGGVVPGNGAQLFIYVAGSVSAKTTVYKDNAGSSTWTNPIVLDSGGNLPSGGVVWIPSGITIKAVWAPSNDTDPPASPYRTIDNISGVNDTTGSQTEWIAGPTATFVSGSQFTLVGDQTGTFKVQRRLKFTVTSGTVYGSISSVSFGAVTTVNVAFASGALDAGLSAVSYSLIDPSNPSINADYIDKQASSVASAGSGTTNIWGVAGNSVHVTGTNATFSFSTAPYIGAQRLVIFDSALSLNSSAAMTMQANTNVTTATNDRALVYAESLTNAVITFYRQSSQPIIGTPTIQKFNASSTYTKPANLRAALIMVKGGGASGATNNAVNAIRGGGGGEGETAWALIAASAINSTTTVTIGAGGGSQAPGGGANGLTGSTSSFGALVTAVGGTGGTAGQSGGAGGGGGSGGSGADWFERGAAGQAGADASGSTIGINAYGGGRGGGSPGSGGVANSGGGGGSGSNSVASGSGGTGQCVVIEFY